VNLIAGALQVYLKEADEVFFVVNDEDFLADAVII